MSSFADTIMRDKYLRGSEDSWEDIADRVVETVMGPHLPLLVEDMRATIRNREFMPGGRMLANAGSTNMLNNCFLYRVEDSKEGIADAFRKVTITGMTGGGVGLVWSDLRPRGAEVKTNGGKSTGPCAFMQAVNEIGRSVVNGGTRRMAIWAGLHWWHADVFEFMALKDWDEQVVAAKAEDFSAYAPMDMTNISVILDDGFFMALEDADDPFHDWAQRVYWTALEKMVTTGEPGFSVDLGDNKYENLRNPCCEITSEDDSDVCCLGSINMARIATKKRFGEVVELSTAFLLCATLTSEVPHEEVLETRQKNRRLGLGIMGVYEWLVSRGYRYEPNDELADWLVEYTHSTLWANFYADQLGVSRPIKTRAIAPTGTIGILAETTTGIEPLFAVAYKRRYLKDGVWVYQYVIDATAQRLMEQYDVGPDDLETAYDLANDPGRRIAFQAFVQGYVDHAISSTLNLPRVEDQTFSVEEFGAILLTHLPNLRGLTVYPDGARGGQPLNVVSYAEAAGQEGIEYEEFGSDQSCVNGVCGL